MASPEESVHVCEAAIKRRACQYHSTGETTAFANLETACYLGPQPKCRLNGLCCTVATVAQTRAQQPGISAPTQAPDQARHDLLRIKSSASSSSSSRRTRFRDSLPSVVANAVTTPDDGQHWVAGAVKESRTMVATYSSTEFENTSKLSEEKE